MRRFSARSTSEAERSMWLPQAYGCNRFSAPATSELERSMQLPQACGKAQNIRVCVCMSMLVCAYVSHETPRDFRGLPSSCRNTERERRELTIHHSASAEDSLCRN
eukprot:s2602_g7.t1